MATLPYRVGYVGQSPDISGQSSSAWGSLLETWGSLIWGLVETWGQPCGDLACGAVFLRLGAVFWGFGQSFGDLAGTFLPLKAVSFLFRQVF